jgi:alpha-tubulin suppressor-like RCC1 family protein
MTTPPILLALLALAPLPLLAQARPPVARPRAAPSARIATFTTLSAGGDQSCGLDSQGTAYCWGSEVTVPHAVSKSLAFDVVSVNGGHACGLATGGVAYCWGRNFEGQVGNGTKVWPGTPAAVSGGLPFRAISAGTSHTCGLTSDGAAYCWGSNSRGQLGDSTISESTVPVAVSGSLVFQTISAGSERTCGVTTYGAAYCWGHEPYKRVTSPVAVSGGLVFRSISVGYAHTCGVTTGGDAYCWGNNRFGQLGDSTTTARTSPVRVSGGLVFQTISAGGMMDNAHTCGLTTSGVVYCWGRRFERERKLSDTFVLDSMSTRPVPAAISMGLVFRSISAGFTHTCGLTTNGAAYCWGWNNNGQLGDGTTTPRRAPVAVRRP